MARLEFFGQTSLQCGDRVGIDFAGTGDAYHARTEGPAGNRETVKILLSFTHVSIPLPESESAKTVTAASAAVSWSEVQAGCTQRSAPVYTVPILSTIGTPM